MRSIVGGMDIHRKQVMFDYLDLVTGEVKCGQIAPAGRAGLRAWLRRFDGVAGVAFAVEACTGWRYVTEELQRAGIEAYLAEPADTAAARGRKMRAKTDKADSRLLRDLLAGGRLPECWIPPAQVLEYRALLEAYHDLRREHTAWVQRVHAVLFHHGAPVFHDLGRAGAPQELATLARAHLSPAGQQQVMLCLRMLEVTGGEAGALRAQLVAAAGQLRGAKVLAGQLYGVGPVTALALCCWLGGAGRFSSARKAVRFTGLDITVYSSDSKRSPRPPVTAGTAGAALVRLRGRQDPRPHRRPRSRLLRGGERPQGRQARRPVRGPQDRPQRVPHPGRARRRRVRHGVTRPG